MKFASLAALWRRVPVELRLLGAGAVVWVVGLASGLPLIPATATQVVLSTYIVPFCVAAIVQLIVLVILKTYRKGVPVYLIAWSVPVIAAAVYLFYQFKSWTPLINPRDYDVFYQKIDNFLWPIRDSILGAREWLATQVPPSLDSVYYVLFVLMFLVALVVYGVFGSAQQQRRLLVGICAALLIGGVSYWVAPAVGPFIFRTSDNVSLAANQGLMLTMYHYIRETNSVPTGYFGAALGAMPSMHFAFATLFLLFTWRSKPWLAGWYIATLIWFFIDSVYLGWHYLVDIPGGVIVALAAYYLARRLVPESAKETKS
jgi:hypothetical protein